MLLYSSIDTFCDNFRATMTITVRNRIILSGTGIIGILLLLFVLFIGLLFREIPLSAMDQESLPPFLLAVLCEVLFSLASVIILYFSFRKTTSPEILFFILFLITIAFDSLKAINLFLTVAPIPPYVGIIVSRIIYFGKYFGTLCVFACGLFPTGIPYERLELFLSSALLLTMVFAGTIPIDMTELEPNYLYATGLAGEVRAISISMYAFAFLNYVLAAVRNGNRAYILIGFGLALCIVGRELLFYTSDPILIIAAFVVLTVGTTLFSERTHEVHLWT